MQLPPEQLFLDAMHYLRELEDAASDGDAEAAAFLPLFRGWLLAQAPQFEVKVPRPKP